jgi:hypothetical protein
MEVWHCSLDIQWQEYCRFCGWRYLVEVGLNREIIGHPSRHVVP